jgi:nitric oxide reductase large subunit
MLEEKLRYPLIVAIVVVSLMAYAGRGPVEVGEGSFWYPTKMILYAFALCIGLFLRLVMRRWTTRFRKLAEGPNPAEQAALEREIAQARIMAYIYWITIAGVCFLGATKPF